MKLGDILINGWAGDSNPQKVLIFIRSTRKYVICLSLQGHEVVFYNDDKLRLTKAGSLDLSAWQKLAVSIREREKEEENGRQAENI